MPAKTKPEFIAVHPQGRGEHVYGPTGGLVPEKQEGLAALEDGSALIVNDNDGVDNNSGETQLLKLENVCGSDD